MMMREEMFFYSDSEGEKYRCDVEYHPDSHANDPEDKEPVPEDNSTQQKIIIIQNC